MELIAPIVLPISLYFTVPHRFPWTPCGLLIVLVEFSWSPYGVSVDSTPNPQILWRVHEFWVDYDKFW